MGRKNQRSFNEIISELRNHPDYIADLILNVEDVIDITSPFEEGNYGFEELKKYIHQNKERISNGITNIMTKNYNYNSPFQVWEDEIFEFIEELENKEE